MKAGGGKAKGSSYEREIAKKLSLWLTAGKRNDCIWRTSNSGGQATVTKSDTQCGDLHAVRPEAQKFFDTFSLELKNYKELDFFQFFTGSKTEFIINKWWSQALGVATRANKEPLLIFKINRKTELLVYSNDRLFPTFFRKKLENNFYLPYMTICDSYNLILLPLDKFLENYEFLLDI